MVSGDLSPLISRLRDKLLAVFFPPRGSLFARLPSHCMTKQPDENMKYYLLHVYLQYIRCLRLCLLCMHSVKKASPWGEAVAQATDEGGSISTHATIQSRTLPTHKKSAKPHSATISYLPKKQKLSPRAPAPNKANQIFALHRRVIWGKFSVSEGGLEGEMTDFATQNLVNSGFAALDSPSKRGLPAPPRSSFPPLPLRNHLIQRVAVTERVNVLLAEL